mgnify:CR=1 FL=1
MCGLKHLEGTISSILHRSHPSWVCGLKLKNHVQQVYTMGHTLRGCVDWNISMGWLAHRVQASHPSWVCGLKQPYQQTNQKQNRHTLRGCVDWNKCIWETIVRTFCHTLRGCVDWNFQGSKEEISKERHTLRGCVDWNRIARSITERGCVTPFVGVWIET